MDTCIFWCRVVISFVMDNVTTTLLLTSFPLFIHALAWVEKFRKQTFHSIHIWTYWIMASDSFLVENGVAREWSQRTVLGWCAEATEPNSEVSCEADNLSELSKDVPEEPTSITPSWWSGSGRRRRSCPSAGNLVKSLCGRWVSLITYADISHWSQESLHGKLVLSTPVHHLFYLISRLWRFLWVHQWIWCLPVRAEARGGSHPLKVLKTRSDLTPRQRGGIRYILFFPIGLCLWNGLGETSKESRHATSIYNTFSCTIFAKHLICGVSTEKDPRVWGRWNWCLLRLHCWWVQNSSLMSVKSLAFHSVTTVNLNHEFRRFLCGCTNFYSDLIPERFTIGICLSKF